MTLQHDEGSTSNKADAIVGPDSGRSPSETGAVVARSVEELTAELAQAEAERDVAVAALDKRGRRHRRRGKTRRTAVGALVALFSIILPITYVIGWAHYVVLNSNGFNKTIKPIGTDPAVTAAAGTAITNQIFTSLDPQQTVANALPPRASFLAGPITNGAKGYIQDGVTKALQSDQYEAIWNQATSFAHQQLLSVLNGDSKAVVTTNGQVVLNLVPLLNAALQNLEGFISGVVGKPVDLPAISGNELPASACQKIGAALDRPVPNTCGQIPLFPADKLTQARHAVRAFNGVMVLLLVLTPVVAGLALWLSRRRRRTLLQLCAGGVLGLVVIRRVVDWLTTTLIDSGQPANKSAREAIVTHLFHQYFDISRWILLGLIIVFIVALITGPYGWAQSLRQTVSHWTREGWNLAVSVSGRARDDRTVAWTRSHLDLLRVVGVAVAVVLLIVLSVSWIGFLVIALLLAGYEWWLYRLGRSATAPTDTAMPQDM
jgi:hypothetical protein